jgi:hypothetical protein
MHPHVAAHPEFVHAVSAIQTVGLTERMLETLADLRMRQALQRPGGGRGFRYS